MKNETRKFSKNKDGSIKVVVTQKNQEVYIPLEGEQVTIGTQESQITQTIIDTEKFYSFMKEQKKNAIDQMKKINKELEGLKHINENVIPESTKMDIEKYLSKKASKSTLKSLKDLNTYLTQVNNKRDRQRWYKHLEEQLKEIESQLAEIEQLL